MLPVLTFVAGIAAGALGVRMLKTSKAPAKLTALAHKARSGFDKAGEELRDVTVSGLSAVEKSSASLRAKLGGQAEAATDQPDAAPAKDDPAAAQEGAKHEKA
ncbi:hypothetical protein M2323_004213 [Rhodoblastus acidophilus]|uniref:hypothetical protein n=1 Tax=Rhodoblastus acidophilus TaxID=1074 RepID=UPI002224557E|nr:hypothetical protein [Rhodoblastus acidophilus]MCW2286418.1 hypothetical protein [Rhodoblastus acidophilus]MCW2335267.1 hypothetical protein [Rhodoblastus acidophilus]